MHDQEPLKRRRHFARALRLRVVRAFPIMTNALGYSVQLNGVEFHALLVTFGTLEVVRLR